ncbi:MAG: hypothetical protein SCALA702_18820 [Melioribacteraceae bacterium]|nr:MAG: hypothetical protein SCALA702_18820 [Melioribacteraceae bacterium]
MKNLHEFSEDIFEDITRLVDNELHNPEREKILLEIINNDDFLRAEYEVQLSVKSLFKTRRSRLSAPSHLIKRINEQLINRG